MTDKEILANTIKNLGFIKKGDFKLSSGRRSCYYIDLRPLILSSNTIHIALVPLVQTLSPFLKSGKTVLCGVTMSGIPLVGSLIHKLASVCVEVSSCMVRTKQRDHGTMKMIEGEVPAGSEVIVIDDVATSGNSLMSTIEILQSSGLVVKHAVVLLDRQDGAAELLKLKGVELHPILTVRDVI